MIARPRRNRVNPFGEIEAAPHRGTLLGNRGDLHGSDGNVIRNWRLQRWISCTLHNPRGRRVAFDTPGTYTPLFFLDEFVSLAAGHRPCASCRPEAYQSFRAAWQARQSQQNQFIAATAIDAELHRWRIARQANRQLGFLSALPAGVFVALPARLNVARLWTGRAIHEWSYEGYGPPAAGPVDPVRVLTPQPIVKVLLAGYRPVKSAALDRHHPDANRQQGNEAPDTGLTQPALPF